jgi:hypothetical protein
MIMRVLLAGVAIFLFAFSSLYAAVAEGLASPIDILLQGKTSNKKKAPIFVIDDVALNRTTIVVGRYRKGLLTGPHHVISLDRTNPEN